MISNRYIDWKAFTPSYVESEMPRFIAEASQALDTIENSEISSYEDLVYALNDATYKLYRMWGALSHLLSVMNSKEWREVQEKYQGEIVAFSLRVGQSQKLYLSAKKLLESNAANDPVRRRILEKMVQSAELSGVSLEGEKKERFNAIAERLAQLGSDFRNAVIDSTPAEISDAVFPEVMKNDPDRSKRERLYRLRSTRAPSNSERREEMLRLRDDEAKMLGFRNYAEKSLATKSAGVPSAAFAMIDKLDAATAKAAKTEEKELAEFSKDELEPWDRAYAAERLREAKYDYSEEELKKYFELETTLAGLFRLTKTLFGVDVDEVSPDEKPPVWHDDVRFFRVKEEGCVIAEFYFDPFVRVNLKSGGAWMNEYSNLSVRKGEKPLALIVMNLPERDENAKVIADLTSRMDKNYPNESDKIYIEGRNAVLQGDIVLFHTRHTVIENLSITGDVTLNFTRDARLEALDISGTLTFGRGASKIIAQDLRLGSAIMDCTKNGEDAIGREPTIRSIVLRDAKATNGVKLIAAEDYGFLNVQIDNIEGSVTIGKEGDTLPSQKYYNLTIYNIKGDIIKHADAKHATFK